MCSLIRPSLLIAAVALAMAGVGRGVRAAVVVKKAPVQVEHRTFDPKHKPADFPPTDGTEDAVTTSDFKCEVAMSVATVKRDLPGGGCRATYRVQKVTATVALTIVVWLPEKASPQLTAHEEAHREIAERMYGRVEGVVREAAGRVDGRAVVGEGKDCEKAAGEKLTGLNQQILDEYSRQIAQKAKQIQDVFDQLTAHGAKADPDAKTAVDLAFEQAEGKTPRRSATQPATRPTKASAVQRSTP